MNFDLDLANMLKAISFWEISIEQMRIRTAESPYFNIYLAFSSLSNSLKEIIIPSDILNFLAINRIAVTSEEAEFLVNLNSDQIDQMSFENFLKTILPQTNNSLAQQVLNNNSNQYSHAKVGQAASSAQLYKKHLVSEKESRNFSEREVARIFEKEVEAYRELEKLRTKLQSEHDVSVSEILRRIDLYGKKTIDFESLSNFMQRIQISFASLEFNALLRRAARDFDSQIDYHELINLLLPHRCSNYSPFRRAETPPIQELVLRKAREFNFAVPEDLFRFPELESPLKLNSIRRLPKETHNPFIKGRNCYLYDKNYERQFGEYKAIFLQPTMKLQKFGSKKGNKGNSHDEIFGDFYEYLQERERNEERFNKYGKRYVYEEKEERRRVEVERKKAREMMNILETRRAESEQL